MEDLGAIPDSTILDMFKLLLAHGNKAHHPGLMLTLSEFNLCSPAITTLIRWLFMDFLRTSIRK